MAKEISIQDLVWAADGPERSTPTWRIGKRVLKAPRQIPGQPAVQYTYHDNAKSSITTTQHIGAAKFWHVTPFAKLWAMRDETAFWSNT